MNIPLGFLILLILNVVSISINIVKHGEAEDRNAWIIIISSIIEWGLIIWGVSELT